MVVGFEICFLRSYCKLSLDFINHNETIGCIHWVPLATSLVLRATDYKDQFLSLKRAFQIDRHQCSKVGYVKYLLWQVNFHELNHSLWFIYVARWRRKAWCLDTRGFIPKKIQWHIHAGLWSLVNWWREALMRHYIRCSWILMTAAVSLMEWPRPW